MKKYQIALALLGIIFFLGIIWVAIQENVLEVILASEINFVIPILILFGLTFLIKAFRWQCLLLLVTKKVRFKDSLVSWCAGYFLSYFTPVRILEPVRALIYKHLSGLSFSLSAPLVIIERAGDLLFFIIVSIFSFLLVQGIVDSALFSLFVILLLVVLIAGILLRKKIIGICLHLMSIFKSLENKKPVMENVLVNLSKSLRAFKKSDLIRLGCLTVMVWLAEAIALYLIIISQGGSLSVTWVMVALSLSTIIALISSIPAGIGILEISLSGILSIMGLLPETALAVVILYRAYSLLFALIAGGFYFRTIKEKSIIKQAF